MNGKYIKIITFLGLLVIVIIQSVWLMKTYQLIEQQLTESGNRIFPKSVLNEVLERLSIITESYGIRKPYISQIRIERSVGKAQYHNRIIR